MIFPILAFILCGLLTQNKAGWSRPKCWKNNLGRCRIRCLDDERYILLCRNKASCCIPIALTEEKHPRPQPSLTFPEDVTLPNSFSVSLNTKFNDEVNFKGNESKETAGTPPSTPMKPTYPQTTVAVSTPKDRAVTMKTPSPSLATSATVNTPSAYDLDPALSVSNTTLQ